MDCVDRPNRTITVRRVIILAAIVVVLATAFALRGRNDGGPVQWKKGRTETYVLNPDGTGKVTFLQQGDLADHLGTSLTGKALQEAATRVFIGAGKGIDAWKDVSLKLYKDGSYTFKGTAYFPKFDELSFGQIQSSWGKGLRLQRLTDGSSVFAFNPNEVTGPNQGTTITDKEFEGARKRLKKLSKFIISMKHRFNRHQRFTLPGKIRSRSGFRRGQNDNEVALTTTGKQVLDAYNVLMNDEAYLAAMCRKDAATQGKLMRAQLHGGNVEAILDGPLKPTFDYTKEVESVKKAWHEEMQTYGIAPKQMSLQPEAGEAWTSKQVTLTLVEKKADARMTVLGIEVVLPEQGLYTDRIEITTVENSDGADLLNKQGKPSFGYQQSFRGGRNLVFKVDLHSYLSEKVTSVGRIEGRFNVWTGLGTRELDLGQIMMKRNAVGNDLGMIVDMVERGKEESKLRLRFGCSPFYIKDIRFTDANGNGIHTQLYGTSGHSLSYRFPNLPKAVRIHAKTYKRILKRPVTFIATQVAIPWPAK